MEGSVRKFSEKGGYTIDVLREYRQKKMQGWGERKATRNTDKDKKQYDKARFKYEKVLKDFKKKQTGFQLKDRMNKKLEDTRDMVNKMDPKARQ